MKKHKKLPEHIVHLRAVHTRRGGWFAALVIGLFFIQCAYNIHSGQPRVLGYSSNIESQQLFEETNQHRTKNGLERVRQNATLQQAAQAKVQDMIAKNYWGHITPDGTTPWTFLERANYPYQSAGENLAYGFSSSSEVINAWLHSPSHRDNMLGDYQEVGFGIARGQHYQGSDNIVVVAFYATPKSPFSASTAAVTGLGTYEQSNTKQVQGLAVIATGGAHWALYASLALIGATTLGFIVTHLELLRLGWYRSKRYLALHPVVDGVIIVIIILLLISSADGFIL